MKTLIPAGLIAALFCFSSLLFAGPRDGLPPVQTDEEKLKFLLYVSDQIPRIFDDAINYDMDIFDILSKHAALAERFEHDENFRKLEAERKTERIRIEIEPAEAPPRSEISGERFDALKSLFKERARTLSRSAELDSRLSERLARLSQVNSNGLLTGLVKTLPKEKQGEAFKASLPQKIEILASSLPDELVSQGFLARNFGIQSTTFTRDEALQLLRSTLSDETDLRTLLMMRLALQDEQGKLPESVEALQVRLEHLTPDALTPLQDKGTLQERIQLIAQASGADKKAAGVLEQAAMIETKALKAESTRPPANKPGRPLRLEEVTPHIGIYRGCIGGDCSTSFSYPYPNSPMERVYFVYGKDGSVKGYVSGTILKVDGKPTFYVHTIAGPTLSTDESTTILTALHDLRDRLGVRQIAVGLDNQIGRVIDFEPIRIAMREAGAGKPELPVEYLDLPVRAEIDKLITSDYDRASTNAFARVFEPDSEKRFLIQSKVTSTLIPPYRDRPIHREDAFYIAAGLKRAGKTVSVKSLLNAARIPEAEFESVTSALDNEEKSPVNEYENKLKQALGRSGIDPEAWRKKKPGLFSIGRAQAPDAFEPAHREETIRLLGGSLGDNAVASHLNSVLFSNKKLSQEELASTLISIHQASRGGASDRAIVSALSDGRWAKNPAAHGLVTSLYEKGSVDSELFDVIGSPHSSWKDIPEMKELFFKILDRQGVDAKAADHLTDARWETEPRKIPALRAILERGKADSEIISHHLASPLFNDRDVAHEFVETIIKRGKSAGELTSAFVQEHWTKDPKTIDYLRELLRSDTAHPAIAQGILFSKAWQESPYFEEILTTLLESGKADGTILNYLAYAPGSERPDARQLIQRIHARGNADRQFVESIARSQAWKSDPSLPTWIEEIMQRGDADSTIASQLLSEPGILPPATRNQLIHRLLVRGTATQELIQLTGSPAVAPVDRWAIVKRMMAQGNQNDIHIATVLESSSWTSDKKTLPLLEKLFDRGQIDTVIPSLMMMPEYAESPRAVEMFEKAIQSSMPQTIFTTLYALRAPHWARHPKSGQWALDLAKRFNGGDYYLANYVLKSADFIAAHPQEAYKIFELVHSRQSVGSYLSEALCSEVWARHPGAPALVELVARSGDTGSLKIILQSPRWSRMPAVQKALENALQNPRNDKAMARLLKNPEFLKTPSWKKILTALRTRHRAETDTLLIFDVIARFPQIPEAPQLLREILERGKADGSIANLIGSDRIHPRLAEELIGKLIAKNSAEIDDYLLQGPLKQSPWVDSHRGHQFIRRIASRGRNSESWSVFFAAVEDTHPKKKEWLEMVARNTTPECAGLYESLH